MTSSGLKFKKAMRLFVTDGTKIQRQRSDGAHIFIGMCHKHISSLEHQPRLKAAQRPEWAKANMISFAATISIILDRLLRNCSFTNRWALSSYVSNSSCTRQKDYDVNVVYMNSEHITGSVILHAEKFEYYQNIVKVHVSHPQNLVDISATI